MKAFLAEFKTFIARGNKSLAAYGTARAGTLSGRFVDADHAPQGVSYSLL